ncbi:UNVERIFIED_ASMBLY: hypothetical protein SD1_62 [Shigella phage 2019SD1]|uniref:Uncharacterized protein n=1 Tax=Shigella phage 2019SD1 TaxID=2848074 RepID=A0A6M5CEL7_9CAUD|nr:hypothetical protein H1N84_gp61 [Shigella phage 2019SD1]
MVNKVEFFKAVEKIDGAPSFFAIHSIDGEDVAYNVISRDGISKLSDRWVILWRTVNVHGGYIVANGKCAWLDSQLEPRRRDMQNPVLLYTLVIEGVNK